MRPMTLSRARYTAGATAVCATLAVVPTTGAADATTTAADTSGGAAATATSRAGTTSKSTRVRKRTRSSVWITQVRRNVLAGRSALVRGKLSPRSKGHVVRLQMRTSKGWKTVDRAATRTGGAFRLQYKPHGIGTHTMRVVFRGDKRTRSSKQAAGRMNVFRQAFASWYGLYGSPLACGGTLGYNELGVAHKTLPCGTKLTLRYHGRSVRVRVIDRGPYVGGRDFDLTGATKRALGFGDLGTVLATK
jgi:rare lipoprotein A